MADAERHLAVWISNECLVCMTALSMHSGRNLSQVPVQRSESDAQFFGADVTRSWMSTPKRTVLELCPNGPTLNWIFAVRNDNHSSNGDADRCSGR